MAAFERARQADGPYTGYRPDAPQASTRAARRLSLDHSTAPYFDAVCEYAARGPGRYHVPGHKGGIGSDPEFCLAVGEGALSLDIPLITHGVDVGVAQAPLDEALDLAADAWGAKRTWFLSNGATQGNHAVCLALAGLGAEVIVQRNVHASMIDGLILSGLHPKWIAPELNPELGIAHCPTPESLEVALADSPEALAVFVVSPTYYGAVADIRALAEVAHSWKVPLIVDEAWGAHFPFHDALPEHALSAGADLVLSGVHKLVGSLGGSAMLHLSHDAGERIDEVAIARALTVVSSTSPSSLLLSSLDAARRHAVISGYELIEEAIAALAAARAEICELHGLEVIDERLAQHPGVYDYDPLRLAIDVRGTGATGYEVAELLRQESDIHLELRSEHILVAVFGVAEPVRDSCQRLIQGLEIVADQLTRRPPELQRARLAPVPRWGPLGMSPRAAFLGRQEAVSMEAAVGRVAAESLAAYPPGIPNVFPGERLTTQTISFIEATLEQGGTVRGLADPTARTIRVVIED